MPAIISDPSLNSGVVSQNQSIFDYPDAPAPSILSFQAVLSQPLPARVSTATGLLTPDMHIMQYLKNFPPELYDLSPSSVLMHFLLATMGDAGGGQLRKLQTVGRLQSAITGTQFYDLDGFYGALFGALRGPGGTLPANPATGVTFNPYTDLATRDAWDTINGLDAVYRERIVALAKAISMGATLPGLIAIAEAITGVPCHAYETWALIDSQGEIVQPLTWDQLQARYPSWNSVGSQTWDDLQGVVVYGGLGINARNEVILRPRKNYPATVAGRQQEAADSYGILSVVEVLKPVCTLVTVDTSGPVVQVPVPIRSLWSDSDYWEIIPKVIIADPADPAYQSYLSAQQADGQLADSSQPLSLPSPPASQSTGTQYTSISDVTSVFSQVSQGFVFSAPVGPGADETTIFPSGLSQTWDPGQALMDPVRAASARSASPVAVQSAPYAGPRVPLVPLS